MASNKSIRELLIQKYGKICFMEAAGIRYIPQEQRRKIKGYKKTDEMLTYHHLTRRCEGGKATEENGALLRWYNHAWLERQPKAIREEINRRLIAFREQLDKRLREKKGKGKMRFVGLEITGDGRIGNQVMMDFENLGEFIEIPLYPNGELKKEEPIDIAEENMRIQNEKQWYK